MAKDGSPPPKEAAAYNPSLVVGLLVEAAQGDAHYTTSEKRLIDRTLTIEFQMKEEQAAALRAEAENAALARPRTFERIGEALSGERKASLMRALWRAALADREKDHWENALARRIGGLLGLSDKEYRDIGREVERELLRRR